MEWGRSDSQWSPSDARSDSCATDLRESYSVQANLDVDLTDLTENQTEFGPTPIVPPLINTKIIL